MCPYTRQRTGTVWGSSADLATPTNPCGGEQFPQPYTTLRRLLDVTKNPCWPGNQLLDGSVAMQIKLKASTLI
jgi:hypothetical protein